MSKYNKVRMKKVTSTSAAVEFQERDCDMEEKEFKWQERVFSKNEILYYKNANNCVTAKDREIHELVKNLEPESQKCLFSFSSPPSEEYQNVVVKSVFSSCFHVKDFELKAHMQCKYVRGFPRTIHKKSIVDYYPVQRYEQSKCDTDNVLQVMYILADLDDNSVGLSMENVVLLCSVNWDPVRKIIRMFPDFNHPDSNMQGYTIVPHKDSRFSYVFWIYQVPPESEKTPLLKILQNPVVPLRDEFATPWQGYLDVHCFGEIHKAYDFEGQKLFINYMFELSPGWAVQNNSSLCGVTVTTKQKHGESIFCHLFESKLTLSLGILEETPGIISWPKFLLEVRSVDFWGCSRVEGYGVLSIPIYPGLHTITVPTWRPAPVSVIDNLQYFFTGITPQLADPINPGIINMNKEVPFLSKYGFTTITTGNVLLKLNIVHHCKAPVKDISLRKNTEFILERLSASTLLNSVNRVVKAFKEARKRIQDASNSP